jgi:L-alanine-DL-glutamate epimerase-like enolase superfamily enzyme
MVDANQAWDLSTALQRMPLFADFGLRWIEEPLRADVPWSHWQILKSRSPAPLSAGENVAGDAAFDALIAARAVSVVQPDVAKWGGHSGTLPVVQRVLAAGLRHCPHYLGGGIGLRHAAHLLAATGGTGRLEIDANDNLLRSLLCGPIAQVNDGHVQLGDAPGIGDEPDLAAIQALEVPVAG